MISDRLTWKNNQLFCDATHQSAFHLSLYILVISTLFDTIASSRLGEKTKPNSPSNYETLQFRLWVPFKSGFDSDQGLPYRSLFHMVYKVFYVNTFYSFHNM